MNLETAKIETSEAARQDLLSVTLLSSKGAITEPVITDRIFGSPLSDRLILAHREAGNIVIDPFREENLQSSSYDVCLGEYYYEEQDPGAGFTLFNPYNPEHVKRVWGNSKFADRARLIMETYGFPQTAWDNIDPDDRLILLKPRHTYLCHTQEFIGFQNVGTTMMKARSSVGRDFLEVCKCAGWGDVGYINRWTMEVTNNSLKYWIPLIVGSRVAQMIFFYTGETDRPYSKSGSYQNTEDLVKLKTEWEAESMLPRLKRY